MKNVIGIYEASKYDVSKPLRKAGIIVFDAWESEDAGYFDLIAPVFDDFAQRDAGITIRHINVLIVLSGSDLLQAIQRTDKMLGEFGCLEKQWLHHLGSIKEPAQPEREVRVCLRRRRLIAIVRMLRAMFSEAQSKEYCVVFGNGVVRTALLGEKIPPGTEVYS